MSEIELSKYGIKEVIDVTEEYHALQDLCKQKTVDIFELEREKEQLQKDNEELQQQIDDLMEDRWNEVGVLKIKLEKIKEYCNEQDLKYDTTACDILQIIESEE